MTLIKTSHLTIIIELMSALLLFGYGSGSQLQEAYSQSLIENVLSGNGSMVSNNTRESLAEKAVDPESLILGTPDQAEENDILGRMVDECGIVKPSSEMEEREEIAECQERIINQTGTSTTAEGEG